MSVDDSYLIYDRRRYGMDHDFYDWSQLIDRSPVVWPNGKRLAVWINVSLQFFPLNQTGKPVPPPGGMTMPYPDLRHFSLRDYGNRVGVYRILEALDKFRAPASFAINADLCDRAPYLMAMLRDRGAEIWGHGVNMDSLHHEAMEDEAGKISHCLETLRACFGRDIKGWLSPARLESPATPSLLAAHGVEYFADWVNDDMPYHFKTDGASLIAAPLPTELEDQFILMSNLHSESSYLDQITDAATFLLRESEVQGGRILGLSVHPWMLGQPHRINYFERVLQSLAGLDGVWMAPISDILAVWQKQQPAAIK
jgi:allantoinase